MTGWRIAEMEALREVEIVDCNIDQIFLGFIAKKHSIRKVTIMYSAGAYPFSSVSDHLPCLIEGSNIDTIKYKST